MKSICFTQEEVRAFMDGSLTKIVRVVKPQPKHVWGQGIARNSGLYSVHIRDKKDNDYWIKPPFGQPGAMLAIKETWAHEDSFDGCKDVHCENNFHIWYKADEVPIVADSFSGDSHWRSPATMPQWAVRNFAVIEAVMVEKRDKWVWVVTLRKEEK